MENKLYYGAAYYPELWPEKAIAEDIKYMKQTGTDAVRIGEFAWSTMEPEQDRIDMKFFVDIVNRLHDNGVDTIFCTPTPTPPIWLSHGHPERMFVDENGKTMHHGARQHMCTNNDFFRERSRIIVEAAAKAVGKLPGVIAWQTDNEFKCHVAECFCETCKQQWHEWLEKRYGTIEKLNDLWGTAIWSEAYLSFDQVPQPLITPFIHNSSLSSAYRIFSREKIAEYQQEQLDIIRKYSSAPITHNSHRWFRSDNELLFKNLDFAAYDMYPSWNDWPSAMMDYDFWRNVKPGKKYFWVMETGVSHAGCITGLGQTHRPGYLAAEAVAAYAAGAIGFNHWLWRQQRTGCEQVHGCIISAWGKPAVGFKSTLEVNKARKQIEPYILSSKLVQPEIAITHSDMARVFFMTEPQEKLDYLSVINENFYKPMLELGLPRDLVFESADLSGYKILITPFVPYLSPELFSRAKKFVESGGTWIVGPQTGGRTKEHTIPTDAGLGELEKYAGVETVFTYPMTNTCAVGKVFGTSADLGGWSAVFQPKTAKAIGVIKGGNTPGLVFLTEQIRGKGKVVMLGSLPQAAQGKKMLKAIFSHYAMEAKVNWPKSSYGTEIFKRVGKEGLIWIVVNLNIKPGSFVLPAAGKDLLTGKNLAKGKISIKSYEYRIIALKP
jgi:beta-galactosidase